MARLPKHILDALRDNKTSLGEHPSFPPEEEEKFIVNLVSEMFEKLTEEDEEENYETLKANLSKVLTECKKQERKCIQSLEELCAKIVNDIFMIPQETLRIEANIVDKVDTSSERLVPEKTSTDFSFDDIEDMNHLSDEIYKRRMINALVTGAAMNCMSRIGDYVKEIFEINSELPSLYQKVIKYNTKLLYYEKTTFNEKQTTDGGKVDVTIGSKDTYPIIKAEALLFPILLEEVSRGILELAVSHGLPKNIEKAKYVISKADFKLAEVWDMRLGFALWKLIEKQIEECGFDLNEIGINFFLMELSEMECDDFNKTLQEIFARTRKGKEILSEILEKIEYNKEKDEFDDYIQTKNDSTMIITDDDCFTSEELITDDYEY